MDHQEPDPGARKGFEVRMYLVKIWEEVPMDICTWPPFPLHEATWVGVAPAYQVWLE